MTTHMKQSIILRMDMGNSKRTEKLRRQYRNILRRFSNAGNYDGYFIGKVSLEFNMAADSGKMSENQAHIIKSRENYAELAAMDIAASKIAGGRANLLIAGGCLWIHHGMLRV